MIHKICVRVSNETFRSLQEEAKKYRVKISVVARDRLMHPNDTLQPKRNFELDEEYIQELVAKEMQQEDKTPEPRSQSEFAALETLYLLREFLFERNAQILKRVDDKMEQRFGSFRQKIR